jgi:5'-nucleotidase
MGEASFPFLSANLHRTGGAPTGWKNHLASTTIKRGGFEVGVVGYTTHDTPTTTLAPNVVGLDFRTDAAGRVAAEVRALRAKGNAPVVLIAHASIEGDLPQTLADTAEHKGEMATLLAGMGADLPDLVVAGHRHAWLMGRVRGVPIVSSSQHGVGLSRIRFCRESVAPALKLAGVERRVAVATTPPRSELGARVAAAMAGWEEKVRPIAEAPVTTIRRECTGRSPRGTRLLDQIARAVADRVGDAAAPPAGVPVVAVVNAGGIRAPLPAGPVRYGDLFTVFPFENAIAACGTTRRGILRFFENALRKDSSRERFPLGIAGAKLHLKRGEGGINELASLEIDGQQGPTDPDAPVWLALPDFILWGGDGLLHGVRCAPSAASQTRVREAWKALLTKEGACDGPSTNLVFD